MNCVRGERNLLELVLEAIGSQWSYGWYSRPNGITVCFSGLGDIFSHKSMLFKRQNSTTEVWRDTVRSDAAIASSFNLNILSCEEWHVNGNLQAHVLSLERWKHHIQIGVRLWFSSLAPMSERHRVQGPLAAEARLRPKDDNEGTRTAASTLADIDKIQWRWTQRQHWSLLLTTADIFNFVFVASHSHSRWYQVSPQIIFSIRYVPSELRFESK